MKQKGFAAPLVLFVVCLVIFSCAVLVLEPSIPLKVKGFVEDLIPKQVPEYTAERRKQDEEIRQHSEERDRGAEGPLTFISTDLKSANERFYLDITTLAQQVVKPVSCLAVENSQYSSLVNVSTRVVDTNIAKFVKEIESHQYSDEYTTIYEDGHTDIRNKGQYSQRTIAYEQICKSDSTYFFIFSGSGPTVHVGGGGSEPSHFAYSDKSGKIVILENIPSGFINLPPSEDPKDYSIPETTSGIAYYGCRQIFAANNSEVLIGCGGGDGPAGGGGIFRVDLNNKTMKEKAFCFSNGVGKYATLCFDESGRRYHQELN